MQSPQVWNKASHLENGRYQAPEALLSVLPHVLFQLVTNHERTIKPRKTASPKAPRRAGVAKGKVPKKPDEAKEEPPKAGKGKKGAKSPAEVQKPPLKPGTDTEKACKESSKAKDTEAQPGGAEASRKTKAGSKSLRPTVSKVGACPTFLVWLATLYRPALGHPTPSPWNGQLGMGVNFFSYKAQSTTFSLVPRPP
uniref:Uncharacterized protein n=1 Tax=Callithrix jacchus TaxID=9483 RepID=A0A8I3X711_CALJA